MPQTIIASHAFADYFGPDGNGVNLHAAISRLEESSIASLSELLMSRKPHGRVFVMGNGGSFDNARLAAQMLRKAGWSAKTPGHEDDYFLTMRREGYDGIFREGLVQDRLGPEDLVIGLSGSGNSPNILEAVAHAREQKAALFCMGGRDGGLLRQNLDAQNFLLAPHTCMEAIEDLHMIAMAIALQSACHRGDIASIKEQWLQASEACWHPNNLAFLTHMAQAMIETIWTGGRFFVLGTGIGANHFRADMGRGATNVLPIRGIHAPECFTMNSAQATCNDDGPDFMLADGLVKFEPTDQDVALLCELDESAAVASHCFQILAEAKTRTFIVGPDQIDLSPLAHHDPQLAIAMLGHASGVILREHLREHFLIEPVETDIKLPMYQKKLGMDQTRAFESEWRQSGQLDDDQVITFCYGKAYKVKAKGPALSREYY